MKKLEKLLLDIKNQNPLIHLFGNGYTIEQVKTEMINELLPFFENRQELENHATTFLVSDWINLLRLKTKYTGIENDINSVVAHYKKARSIDSPQVFSVIRDLSSSEIDTGNKFWSLLNLEVDRLELEFEEFVQVSMRDLVGIIEGLTKVFLIEMLAIDRITRGKIVDVDKIKALDLGVIVDELVNQSPFPHLFKIAPQNLRLSDWRNIGAHLNYRFESGDLICEYGAAKNRKSIILTRQELFEAVNQCNKSLEILNISHKFFSFDNFYDIVNTNPIKSNSYGRVEIGFLMFTSGVMSQGFEIIDAHLEKDGNTKIILRDLTDGEPVRRAIHSAQFIYNLWTISKGSNVMVEYHLKNGDLYSKASLTSIVCKQFQEGAGEDWGFLAENTQWEVFKINKTLN